MSKLTHDQAAKLLQGAGITWSSSGNCSIRSNRHCTSFDQINSATIDGVIALKKESNCAINITGGTEVGHAGGTISHGTGYKLDITPNEAVSKYITTNFKYIGERDGDHAKMYKAHKGTIYARERDHRDITFNERARQEGAWILLAHSRASRRPS